MNIQEEKDTYQYHLMRGDEVVEKGITYDLVRREAESQSRFPGTRIKQIGDKVTRLKAIKWERDEWRKHYGLGVKWPKMKQPEVASIPTKNFKEVVEISVPTRFYWNKDGGFDGIEFGPFKNNLLPWQEDMMMRCLDAVGEKIEGGSAEREDK